MARPRLGDTDSKRLQMVITEGELAAIDDWQHENRVASRSEAIRRLCQIGLATDRPVGLAGNALTNLYEMSRTHHNELTNLQIAARKSGDRRIFDKVGEVIDGAVNIHNAIEILQLLLVDAQNQVAELADPVPIEQSLEMASKWREAAADHLKKVRRRHAARAKK